MASPKGKAGLSPGDLVVSGAQAPALNSVRALVAAGRLSSGQMPVVRAVINGRSCVCLVDTGCGCTMVATRVVEGPLGPKGRPVILANGNTVDTGRDCWATIELAGRRFSVRALAEPGLDAFGVDCLLGDDVVDHMGGVTVKRGADKRYQVTWGASGATESRAAATMVRTSKAAAAPGVVGHSKPRHGATFSSKGSKAEVADKRLTISDKDFEAAFANGRWTVSWRWSAGEPRRLQSRVSEYASTRAPGIRERYVEEIETWISNGWLVEWDGPVKGIVPLLAVNQPNKGKVRPVMDYRELNAYVESHTGDEQTAVCAEKVRKWRQLPGELKLVDLKSAYLQVHVSRDLWQYQVVRYKGKLFALTRLGFGLTCAPRIMTMILGKVLSLDPAVGRGTDHYIDDIIVQESVVSADRVRVHLRQYGLVTKEPESLRGGRVLGIALRSSPGGGLTLSRGSTPLEEVCPPPVTKVTKRGVFSVAGLLTGHYPVAGWLRPCCSYLKRLSGEGAWDVEVSPEVKRLVIETVERAKAEDPVKGPWGVNPKGQVKVWTDASSLAMGVVLQVDGGVVEDASWLRKKSDAFHINVAELEAVGRGINLALAWGFKTFTIATDSRTVLAWLSNTVEGTERVRTKGAAQMLIKRRLVVIKALITEFSLSVDFEFVPTNENLADALTRVPKRWLGRQVEDEPVPAAPVRTLEGATEEEAIRAAHVPHHLGVDRTLFLVSRSMPWVTRADVSRVLASCEPCARIDPAGRAENRVEPGDLAVEGNWARVAIDVTHYNGAHFLSMVDCGPSRFTVWRRLPDETASSALRHLRQVMLEHGPVAELLMDNATIFRSGAMEEFAKEWGIALRFRAAYVPSGNGIVERNHRTIKRIAARGGISPEEAVFWYNTTPRSGTDATTVPTYGHGRRVWRLPDEAVSCGKEAGTCAFSLGDKVWVKPPVPSCTRQWTRGTVTAIQSQHTVCVDGMPRHVRDLRKRRGEAEIAVLEESVGEEHDDPDLYEPVSGVEPPEEAGTNTGATPGDTEEVTRGSSTSEAEDGALGSEQTRRSGRQTRRPAWHSDYAM